ncbi:hypothetical protein BY996DRAFT_6409434 [Phakopsora pachyrhizi]|nr:hypothetical protein BY996DRAFT_6409434 [Phakopsora pachyrhizi]
MILVFVGARNSELDFDSICRVGLILTKPQVEENYLKGFYENLGDLGALKNWYFWVILLCNTIQALSYFIPGLFLPNYAHTLSLSQTSATILLSVLNGVLGIWGGLGAHGMVSLVPFSLIFGLAAGAWTSFYFSMIYELTDRVPDKQQSLLKPDTLLWNRLTWNLSCRVVSLRQMIKEQL